MNTVFPAPQPITVPVAGSDAAFPVRHVYCVGRNYAEHTKEMGGDTKEPPFFFTKFADALVPVAPPGVAEIGYSGGTPGSGAAWRSQTKRFMPAAAGSGVGLRIQ